MIIYVCAFTSKGKEKAMSFFESQNEYIPVFRNNEDLSLWTKECMEKSMPILFVGALAIAVRHISPYVQDKFTDSPVIVMDEKAEFVIPVLSGHLGGANELAKFIARRIGAIPVITTATDVNGLFSVDCFAKNSSLGIVNRDGIKKVSKKLLEGESVTALISKELDSYSYTFPKEIKVLDSIASNIQPDIFIGNTKNDCMNALIKLYQKHYIVGIGCKKDKDTNELIEFVLSNIKGICEMDDIISFATIDIKKHEQALCELSMKYHIPIDIFSSEELEKAPGQFTTSQFVKNIVGVDNVCERAAICSSIKRGYKFSCKDSSSFVKRKTSENGMTISIVRV